MTQRNLDALFAPRAIAVIGAGRTPGSLGRVVLGAIAAGFKGPLAAVHPTADNVNGVAAFPSVAALPFVPDLAVIATPPAAVPGLIAELGAKGCRGAVVITAGFGEGNDAAGAARQRAMLEAARPHVLRILGPNCLGLVVPRLGLNASFARVAGTPGSLVPGSLAVVAQSGAVAATLLDWAGPRGIGLSVVASLGGMADVDFGDMLDYLAGDAHTRAILLYVEAVTSPRKFMSAARAAARLKPVVVIKSGRTAASAKAAASHTGALAGADAVYDAAFARAGLVRVDTLADLFDTAALLSAARRPAGERLMIVTNGGGMGVMAADALVAGGGRLAALSDRTRAALDAVLPRTWSRANPVDIIGDADGERYRRALDIVLDDPGADAVLALYCPTAVSDPDDTAAHTIAAAAAARVPVLAAWVGDQSVGAARRAFANAKLPGFTTAEEAVAAFNRLNQYRRRQEALMEVPPPAAAPTPAARAETARILAEAAATPHGWVPGHAAKHIAALYGIPTNRVAFAATPAAAVEAAHGMTGRLALKIVSPDIVHKSDVGGVALDLDGPAAVRIAAAAMVDRLARLRPGARLDGFLVEEMIDRRRGQELILGLAVDATFGPVVAFGHGGTAVEVIDDKALGLPPLNLALARHMIDDTRVGRLLKGYRDQPAADLDAVAAAIVALSALTVDHPTIADLDINPLLASAAGVIALDVRIRVAGALATPGGGPVISPYPDHLATTLALPDGTRLAARPIRPEDEPALRALVRALSPEDARFRFFTGLKDLDHHLAARLTQIDYDREMAFVAAPENAPTDFWGVVRLHGEPDGRRAEYAVTVRSDKKGLGLGTALMKLAIAEARRRGVAELWGDVLAGNARMLALAAELGFAAHAPPGEPTVVRTVLRLAQPG